MSMSADQIHAEAVLLDTAEQTRVQCRQTTSVHADITMDEAYAVQAAWRDLKVGRGERIVGHKIGLTSRAMQEAMKITTPVNQATIVAGEFVPDARRTER